jgi:hypothetical protein
MYPSTLQADDARTGQEASSPEYNIPPSAGVSPGSVPCLSRVEEAPHWQPILRALGSQVAAEFVWVTTTDTIETYGHRETHRYVHIDGTTGEFLNQRCEVISTEKALEHARKSAVAKIVPAPQPEPVVEVFAQAAEPEPFFQTFSQAAEPEPFFDTFARVNQPEPGLESFAPYEERERVVEVYEHITEPVTEPGLNAFTRTHALDPEPPFWGVLAAKLEAFQPGLSSSLGLFAEVRQKVVARIAGWRAHPFSSSHDPSHGVGSGTPDAQQVNFGMFTRRTSVL